MGLADPVSGPGSGVRRIEFRTEEEPGRHQHLLQRQSDARLETAILRALLIEREQLGHVFCRHRAPIGVAGEVGENFLRAGHFVDGSGRMTAENLFA